MRGECECPGGGGPAPGVARSYSAELCTHRRRVQRRSPRPRVCALTSFSTILACSTLLLLLFTQPTARVQQTGSAVAHMRLALAEELHKLAARRTAGSGEAAMSALAESAEQKMLNAVMKQARAQVEAEKAEAKRKLERTEVRDFATPVQAVVAHNNKPRDSHTHAQGRMRAEETVAAALAKTLGANASKAVSVLQATNTTSRGSAVPVLAAPRHAQDGTRNATVSAIHPLSQQALQRSPDRATAPVTAVSYRNRPLATFIPSGQSGVRYGPSPVGHKKREEDEQVMLQLGTMLWIAVSVFAVMASAKTIRGHLRQRAQVKLLQEVADLQRRRDLGMISEGEFRRALEPLLETLNAKRDKASPPNTCPRTQTVSEVDRLKSSYARQLSAARIGLVLFDSDGDMGFVVRTVKPGSAAALSRKIHAGDRLLSIGGTYIEDLSDEERNNLAIRVLREATLFVVRRIDGTERQVMLACPAPVEIPGDLDRVSHSEVAMTGEKADPIEKLRAQVRAEVCSVDTTPQCGAIPPAGNAELERVSKEVEAVAQRLDQVRSEIQTRFEPSRQDATKGEGQEVHASSPRGGTRQEDIKRASCAKLPRSTGTQTLDEAKFTDRIFARDDAKSGSSFSLGLYVPSFDWSWKSTRKDEGRSAGAAPSYAYGSISQSAESKVQESQEEICETDELMSNAWPHLPVPCVEQPVTSQYRAKSSSSWPAWLREDGKIVRGWKRAKKRCDKDLEQPAIRAVLALILLVSSICVAAALAPVALLKAVAVLMSGICSALMVSLFSNFMLSVAVESSNADSIVMSACLSSKASAVSDEDDHYVDWLISITAGCGAGQTRRISAYNASTKTLFISRPWECDPDMTSTCVLYVDPWLNPMSIFEHIFSQHEPLEAPRLTRRDAPPDLHQRLRHMHDSKRLSATAPPPKTAPKPLSAEERIKDYIDIVESQSGSATSYERRRQQHRAAWADENLAPPDGPPDSFQRGTPQLFLTARDTDPQNVRKVDEAAGPRTRPAPSVATYQGRPEASYQDALAFLEAATSAYAHERDSAGPHAASSDATYRDPPSLQDGYSHPR